MKIKFRKKIWIPIIIIAAILVIFGIYLNTYYHADNQAIKDFTADASVNAETLDDCILYEPDDPSAGFIFYPGGKVEYTAYEPLMQKLADNGILCILVKMPFNLAVFNADAADQYTDQYSQIKHWYIGGHSLGGAMAASYVSKHTTDFDGLVLLGAYSTADLTDSGLKVLSIYGNEDGVLNQEKYQEDLSNLPDDFKEVVIDGGCHAGFGMYGAQSGDGTPTISNEEQIQTSADEILSLINS